MPELRTVLAGLALVGIAGHASAQDAAEFDWSGPYIGAYVAMSSFGVDISDANNQFTNDAPSLTETMGSGGIYAGLNWQLADISDVVLGLEVDFGSDLSQTEFFSTNAAGSNGYEYDLRLTTIGSISARAGLPSGRTLFYVIGGFSQTDVEMQTYQVDSAAGFTDCGNSTCAESSEPIIGLNLGVGLDYAAAENVVVRFDIRHFAFDTLTADVRNSAGDPACASGTVGACTVSYDPSVTQVRLGLAYKF